MRRWLWIGTVIDLLLLLPGLYVAYAAFEVAMPIEGTSPSSGIALLYALLPVFCIVAPVVAWRRHGRDRDASGAVTLGLPIVYAGFLAAFLFYG